MMYDGGLVLLSFSILRIAAVAAGPFMTGTKIRHAREKGTYFACP